MVKAFLSHSSIDKDLVRRVKRKLQRIWTYFDEDCFEPGEDFRSAITTRLSDTNLFVFFASRNSVESAWVQFELDEAYWQAVKRDNIKVLVLTLDNIPLSHLPAWMQKGKFEIASSPDVAAQIIRKLLLENLSIYQKIYLGREEDTRDMYADITNNAEGFPSIIAISGLSGIGRKTFVKNVLSQRFSLDYYCEFYLDSTDGLIELYRKILDENIASNSAEESLELYQAFLGFSAEDRIAEISRAIAVITDSHVCPIIIDNGAMLNDMGYYKDEYLEFIRFLSANFPDHYLALIHTRVPKLPPQDRDSVYIKRLYALDEPSTYALFDALLRRNNVPVSNNNQAKEISQYLDGYPPAIINAARECKLEGVDIVCNDKTTLVDFQSRIFSKYFTGLPLSETELLILELIHNVGSMTIIASAILLQKTTEEIAVSLRVCHDFNIVELRNNGIYSISPPMRIALDRKLSKFDKTKYSQIASQLIDNLWDEKEDNSFETMDIIINAILRSEQEDHLAKFKNFILPSHLLKAANQANEATDWQMAEKYARKAIALDESLYDAHILLFKVLVRQENSRNQSKLNAEEDSIIELLSSIHDKRRFYLVGFRLWKRGRFYEAIREFLNAKNAGDDSIQLHRDLAECYYQVDQLDKAQEEIDIVTKERKISNAFILDLASKIAISQSDFGAADELLSRQALVDRYENLEHRRATYYVKASDYDAALEHATNACNGDRSLAQMHLLKMNIAIHLGKYSIVEDTYNEIEKSFRWFNRDLREVLYATMLLKRNGWRAAEAASEKIKNKNGAFALNLRYKIVSEKSRDSKVPLAEQKKAEQERIDLSSKKTMDALEQLQFYNRA